MEKVYLLFECSHEEDGKPETLLCSIHKSYEAAEKCLREWIQHFTCYPNYISL